MKKSTYIYGLISCIIIICGVLFKIMHWPGANVLLSVGTGLIVLLFLPFALINNYRNVANRPGKIFYIIIYITCVVFYVSALFKIMHWPGAGKLLMIAIPFPFVVFLPALLYYSKNEDYLSINQSAIIILFLAYMSIMTAMLSLSVSKAALENSIHISNTVNELNRNISKQIEIESLNIKHSENEALINNLSEISEEGEKVYALIDEIMQDIVINAGYDASTDFKTTGIDLRAVINKDRNDPVVKSMLSDNEYGLKLKKAIEAYNRIIQSKIPDNETAFQKLVQDYFSVADIQYKGDMYKWESFYFEHVNTTWALSNLIQFQSNILFTESELLNLLQLAELKI